MKKIKMMLLSLALFAVVGGALAFKARFIQKYCTASPVAACATTWCPIIANNSTTIAGTELVCTGAVTTYTTEDEFGNTQSFQNVCTKNINAVPGHYNETTTVQCVTTTLLTPNQ